jgi:nucleoside-diphosphate-sugar epimerase
MKIVILGGTGLIGSALQKSFSKTHQVEVFNRTVSKSTEYLSSIIDGRYSVDLKTVLLNTSTWCVFEKLFWSALPINPVPPRITIFILLVPA